MKLKLLPEKLTSSDYTDSLANPVFSECNLLFKQ